MPPSSRLPLPVLLSLGLAPLPALADDTGDTGDDTAVHPCLSPGVKDACADGALAAVLVPGLVGLAVAGRRRRPLAAPDREALIAQLSEDGVLPEDVAQQLRPDRDRR